MTILAMSYPLPLHPTWQVILGCDSSLLEAILERLKIALIIPTFQSRSRKESHSLRGMVQCSQPGRTHL